MDTGMDPSPVRDLIRLGRFRFIAAGALVFVLGAVLALWWDAPWDPVRLLLGYVVFGCGHLSLNYSNEYHDRRADSHGAAGSFSGGTGILVARPELAPAARRIAIALIASSLALAVLFQYLYHPVSWFVLFVLAGNLLGWYYTAPPLAFSYHGLGELATAAGLGFMMPGIGYLVVKGTLDPAFLLCCIPVFSLGYFFILSVELPDLEGDRDGGKITAVVRMGREAALRSIAAAALLATLLFLLLGLFGPDLVTAPMVILGIVSLIPLAAGILAWRAGARDRAEAEARTRLLVTSLVLLFLLADLSLAVLIAQGW